MRDNAYPSAEASPNADVSKEGRSRTCDAINTLLEASSHLEVEPRSQLELKSHRRRDAKRRSPSTDSASNSSGSTEVTIGSNAASPPLDTARSSNRPPTKRRDQGVHECPICQRVLRRRDHLQQHMYTHLDARPYMCTHDGCGKRYKQAFSLARHQKEAQHTGKRVVKPSAQQLARLRLKSRSSPKIATTQAATAAPVMQYMPPNHPAPGAWQMMVPWAANPNTLSESAAGVSAVNANPSYEHQLATLRNQHLAQTMLAQQQQQLLQMQYAAVMKTVPPQLAMPSQSLLFKGAGTSLTMLPPFAV